MLLSQSLNGVKNAPTASGPTPDRRPEFESFLRAVQLMRELQQDGVLLLGVGADGQNRLQISVADQNQNDPQVAELLDLLNLKAGAASYGLLAGAGDSETHIQTNLRSLMGVLFYVSQSVEVPQRDIDAGRVNITKNPDGSVFEWHQLTGELLRVRSELEPPSNAYVAVPYRDAWFYIDDSDLNSKSTFALLSELSALAAGSIETKAPVLTLPIN